MYLHRPKLSDLLIIGTLLLFISSCYLSRFEKESERFGKNIESPFADTNSVVFRTEIDMYNVHLTGITIFKNEGNSTFRSVFINEAGMKFFDFRIYPDSSEILQIFSAMDKKMFKKLLIEDFRTILLNSANFSEMIVYRVPRNKILLLKPENERTLYFLNETEQFVARIEKHSALRLTSLYRFEYDSAKIVRKIDIKHKNIKFTMGLEKSK